MWQLVTAVAVAGEVGSLEGRVVVAGPGAWVFLVPQGGDPGPPGDGRAEIRQVGDNPPRFDVRALVVPRGTTVDFPNDGPLQHNVHWVAKAFAVAVPGMDPPRGDDLETYGVHESRSRTLEEPGLYSIGCKLHAEMHADLLVVPNRWLAEVHQRAYRIDGIAPGKYLAVAWTPKAFSVAEVEIRADHTSRFDWSSQVAD